MADLPVTIIGGYLGAGKTTLVNSLLRQAQGQRRLAILVNDFGDIAIDADLIEATDANMLQLAGGCVCCTIGNDMIDTLVTLKETMGNFDHVIVETSGVALPGTVASTIQISTGVRPDGVIVLADAVNVSNQLSDKYIADTIERQLDAAQLLVLTKTDRLDPQATTELREKLSARFPNAHLIQAENGNLPLDAALDVFDTKTALASAGQRPFDPGFTPDRNYVSSSWTYAGQTPVQPLIDLLAAPKNQVLRAKGYLTDEAGTRRLIQVVASDVAVSDAPQGVQIDSGALVVIGLTGTVQLEKIDNVLLALGWKSANN